MSSKTVAGGTRAPQLPSNVEPISRNVYGDNVIIYYAKRQE